MPINSYKVLFLTSNPIQEKVWGFPKDTVDYSNSFVENLKKYWKPESRGLFITASPEDHANNDRMSAFYRKNFAEAGFTMSCFDVWDSRNTEAFDAQKLAGYDFIFMGGGHVPTQNEWFKKIDLPTKILSFHGVLMGLSAGSMNSAIEPYAWAEAKGEAIDPHFKLFRKGLGCSRTVILPHIQAYKDHVLDGKRVLEDIAFVHSRKYGKQFIAMPDGSYVIVKDGVETVYGEAYLVKDGVMKKFCEKEQSRVIFPEEREDGSRDCCCR